MKNYIKAKDLKIGDSLLLQSSGGKVSFFTDPVSSIELKQYGGKRYLSFNGRILFKENSSKGMYYYRESDILDTISALEADKHSYDSTLFFTDKRIATTHAVNFLKVKIEQSQEYIKKELERLNTYSLDISNLRYEEFNNS